MAINVKTSSPTVKVQVGTANAIKVLSSASGGATFSENARNVIGGIASVTQLSVTGPSTLTGNLYVTGITTIAGLTTTGSDLYVGGDLFVQDDLVLDEITARHLNITGITTTQNLVVTGVATIGGSTINAGTFDQIKVSGLSTFVGVSTFNSNIFIEATTDTNQLNVSGIASINTLDTLNVIGLSTIGGNLTLHSSVNQLNVTGVSTFNDDVEFAGGSGVTSSYWDKSESSLKFLDNSKIKLGSNSELEIFHNAGNSYIYDTQSGLGTIRVVTNQFEVRSGNDSELQIQAIQNSFVNLYYNNLLRFQTLGLGVTVFGNTETQTLNVTGLSTFTGIVTTASDLYVGGDLYVQDDIVLDEITANNLNITGLATFVGNAQFNSNVSIAGTLTYEDVTNVDSVGIVTAGKGFRATTGGLIVTAGVSTFGAIATFTQNVFVDGTLTAGLIDGGTY